MTIWLSHGAAAAIERSASLYHPLETGGMLLGWRDGRDRIVAGLLGPGPRALHGRHTFIPDHQWQVAEIRIAFDTSGGDLDYLGDWHTHPGGIAAMSALDGKTLSKIARRVRRPIMVIAAGDPEDWTINGWSAEREKLFARPQFDDEEIRLLDPPLSWPSYFGLV